MNRCAARMGRGFVLLLSLLAPRAPGAEPRPIPAPFLRPLAVRPLGPANMGGRVAAVAVVEKRPSTFFAAAASGGLWKTVNNGITWIPVFDRQTTGSVGAVAVAPSNPEVVWAGTGEANPRNSVSWGDGVYRSADGGGTWEHRGLRQTRHVARVVIHPRNPDTVYVAALGHVWGPNKQRGVFKTTDGGKNWEHSLKLGDDTGCADLAMDPAEPETLYAAAYRVRRDAFDGNNPVTQFGPAAGLYKTTDGGKTWNKLTRGLPDRPFGRCGLAVSRRDPRVLYAVVQTDRTDIRRVSGQPARTSDRPDTGGVFRSADRGETWTKLNDLCPRPFYFGQVRFDPGDPQRVYVLGVRLYVSDDAGKTFRPMPFGDLHADQHDLWIDPADSAHLVLASDGGVFLSYDRGANWEHVQNLPIGQFYSVSADMRRPYRVYGGLQDNGIWTGPSRTRRREGITMADWTRLMGADGFACASVPTDPDTLYAEWQWGRLERINVRTGVEVDIQPKPASGAAPYRFNWNAPLLLSPHNPRTLYFGGNFLFRSIDRGEHWRAVSPDLTLGRGPSGPGLGHHTLTAVAESPLRAGLLWAGSDDGRVHVRRNGGGRWIDVSANVPGVPATRWVSRIECSPFAEGTAYLAIDRHRNDDPAPYLFKTEDYGETWKPLTNGLPKEGPVRVIKADRRNRNILYVGTEFGLFVSGDGGGCWQPLGGLPPVAVHDLFIHPRDRELVIATHGRGLYVLDVAPLQEATAKVLGELAHLFDVKPATAFEERGGHGFGAGKHYLAPNPPYGAAVYYHLKEKAAGRVRLTVSDALGNLVAQLPAGAGPGLHRVQWNLRHDPGALFGGDTPVPAGEYVVRLTVGGRVVGMKTVRVRVEE